MIFIDYIAFFLFYPFIFILYYVFEIVKNKFIYVTVSKNIFLYKYFVPLIINFIFTFFINIDLELTINQIILSNIITFLIISSFDKLILLIKKTFNK